ncbi:MAG: helix-turn-helix domain-containing protein [Victivallaceae bacterium]|jgi:AraC-like DNA-binding protein
MANLRYGFNGREIGLPMIYSGGFHNYLHTISLLPHTHPEGVEITYVMKGDACWLLKDGTELFLSGGTLAAVQPDTPHHGQGNIISPCWLFWFVLDLEAADCLLNTPFSAPDIAELKNIFQHAGNCVRRAPDHYEFHTERLIEQFASPGKPDFLYAASLRNSLCRLIIDTAEVFRSPAGIERPDARIAGKAEKIMRAKLGHDLNMTDIAEELGLSATGFIKRFKYETGLTPADFSQRIKIEEARRRLTMPKASITAIAFDLGFSSSQYFASVFKKYTGITPREYRDKAPAAATGCFSAKK